MEFGEGGSGTGLLKRIVRAVVALAVLGAVIAVLYSIVKDYRTATGHAETTSTAEATGTAGSLTGEPYVTVLSDGLNLRAEPSTSSGVVSVLDKDQRLQFVEEVAGWFHVKTDDGAEGWVAAGGRYTELVRP